jgi:hypothetical protein
MDQDVSIRLARRDEQTMLESLQRRASLNNPGDRDAIFANPDAITLPIEQITSDCVFVAERDDVVAVIASAAAHRPAPQAGEICALFAIVLTARSRCRSHTACVALSTPVLRAYSTPRPSHYQRRVVLDGVKALAALDPAGYGLDDACAQLESHLCDGRGTSSHRFVLTRLARRAYRRRSSHRCHRALSPKSDPTRSGAAAALRATLQLPSKQLDRSRELTARDHCA